jgi:hypothetical protein
LILGCEEGIISIYEPQKNKFVTSFSIKDAISEEMNGGDEENDNNIGDICEIKKTKNPLNRNEYMVIG